MLSSTSSRQSRQLPLPLLIGASFAAQLLSIYPLWEHISNDGQFLGRYSNRYAVALVANIGLIILWGLFFLKRDWFISWLRRLTLGQRLAGIILSGVVVVVLLLLPIELPAKQYAALNWLLLLACLVYTLPDQQIQWRWSWVIWGALVILFTPSLITILADHRFSPDEAMWADYATSPFEANGLYSRTWLQEPITISPGLGWSVAGYGYLLENVAFDIKIGRLLNFCFYILAFIGIGAVTWRLYGRLAAIISSSFAALSLAFIPVLDFRPDHQLPAMAMLVFFAALQARYSTRYRGLWNFLCGLGATLSLEVHAAGIAFALGFSLFYLAEFILEAIKQRRFAHIRPVLYFGFGAFIGTGIYYYFNIQAIGGLQAYLQFLANTRFTIIRGFGFLSWPSLFEGAVILAALTYIAWRRSAADRLLLSIIVCVVISAVALVPQGYPSMTIAFYVIPVGALIVSLLPDPAYGAKSLRLMIIALGLLTMLTVYWAGEFVAWSSLQQVIQTGELPPSLYDDLKPELLPLLKADDVVASTHQLIWVIPRHPQLVFVGAERTGVQRWHLTDPEGVWEQVKPTIVVNLENQMTIQKGLQNYMDLHHFTTCNTFIIQGIKVTTFRQSCFPIGGS